MTSADLAGKAVERPATVMEEASHCFLEGFVKPNTVNLCLVVVQDSFSGI